MLIRIKNLRLRTIIGFKKWEREKLQDVIVNIEVRVEGERAAETDSIKDSVDYKKLNKKIIEHVESSQYFLLEKLAASIFGIIMEDKRVLWARVEVDKPHALRFADSVSVEVLGERPS